MTVSARARGGGGSAKKTARKAGGKAKNAVSTSSAAASAAANANAVNAPPSTPSVWRPGYDPLEEDETLQYDPTAYDCMHTFTLEWPCLSFDVLRDAATAARVANASNPSSSAVAASTKYKKSSNNAISTATTPAAAAAVASFPHTLFLAAGTQAATRSANSLSLLRLGRVGRGKHGPAAARVGDDSDDSDELSSDSDDDDESDAPTLAARRVRVNAGVNRVRSMPQQPGIVAAWLDTGVVSVWDLRKQLAELEAMTDAESARAEQRERNPRKREGGGGGVGSGCSTFLSLAPVASHRHGAEGFGLAWSPGPAPGRLASGDCGGGLRVWEPREGGASASATGENQSSSLSWAVSQNYGGHEHGDGGQHRASVEDVAWSPTEATVLATAATDAALRIFDVRAPSRPQLVVRGAHASDVNVVSWSPLATFMLASGGDDGAVKAWDLRAVAGSGGGGGGSDNSSGSSSSKKVAAATATTAPGEVARLCYHRGAVTSVEWSFTESSVLLSTGDSTDGTTCVWDLAVERDPEEEAALGAGAAAAAAALAAGGSIDESAIPPQLLFVHAGQADVKEAHWHPQIDGLVASTAADGFNVWRASNV